MMLHLSKEYRAMTTSYYADRINLFHLMHVHPEWSQQHLAQALGRSKSWVYKWQTRFKGLLPEEDEVLHEIAQGQSRARKHPPERLDPRIEALILSIRDEPKDGPGADPRPQSHPLLLAQADHLVGKRPALAHLDAHGLSDLKAQSTHSSPQTSRFIG
jgi:hypothetical protein